MSPTLIICEEHNRPLTYLAHRYSDTCPACEIAEELKDAQAEVTILQDRVADLEEDLKNGEQ